MIELPRNPLPLQTDLRIKILGLGGAGSNALDRIHLDGAQSDELVAMNTDTQALTGSVAPHKVQLGAGLTRGLGAGGDPELGFRAAEESADEIRAAIGHANVVFICVGLGGGTGSGAAPLVASCARDQEALVVVFATMPFSFEGKRRMSQAEESLAALQQSADVVICFENDRMADSVSPRAPIQEAFSVSDQTISQSVRAISSLLRRRGLLHVGFDEIVTALRQQNPRCLFGYGEAEGDHSAHQALERALKSPLMDRGRMLADVQNVLIQVAGGPQLTLNEVQILMEEFNRHISDTTRVLFGAVIDPQLGNRLAVTILSSLDADGAVQSNVARPSFARPVPAREIFAERPVIQEPVELAETSYSVPEEVQEEVPPSEALFAEEPPVISPVVPLERPGVSRPAASAVRPPLRPTAAEVVAAKRETRQEQMQFEPVTRGRFEKSEPTIIDGQDLDVPTFLRRNVRAK
jgi:cell division protein FtsZ